jgi:DNA topoisomerase IB
LEKSVIANNFAVWQGHLPEFEDADDNICKAVARRFVQPHQNAKAVKKTINRNYSTLITGKCYVVNFKI